MSRVDDLRKRSAALPFEVHEETKGARARVWQTNAELCQELMRRIDLGERVSVSDVRLAVGSLQSRVFDEELSNNRTLRDMDHAAQIGLRPYTHQLQIADLLWSQSERRAISDRARRQLQHKAEAKYEEALDTLAELVSKNAGLVANLDRPMDWGKKNGAMAGSQVEVPRRTTHAAPMAKIKREALNNAVSRLSAPG